MLLVLRYRPAERVLEPSTLCIAIIIKIVAVSRHLRPFLVDNLFITNDEDVFVGYARELGYIVGQFLDGSISEDRFIAAISSQVYLNP